MITRKNELTVPEVACHSREAIEGGTIVRYLIRQPGETEWRAVKVFRPTEPVATQQEVKRSSYAPTTAFAYSAGCLQGRPAPQEQSIMSEQYFVEITDTISVPTPDAERVGPFYRYEDAEGWIDGTVETYVEHLSDRHQEWLLEQDGDTADLDGDPRVEWDAASEKRVVYDPAGTLVATYAITWEEDEDGVSEST